MSKTITKELTDAATAHADSVETIKRNQERKNNQEQINKEEAIKQIFEMSGKIKAVSFIETQTRMMKILYLKQVKDAKEYRERFGMTWDQFCEWAGENRRRIDEQLMDLKPFKAEWLTKFVNAFGCDLNKIKYLGEEISADSAKIIGDTIIYKGEEIDKDSIVSFLETLEETHKKEKDEADTNLRAQKRLTESKEDTIKKMEREIKRLERTVPKADLTEEEQEAVNLLHQVQVDIMSWFSDIKKKIKPHTAPEIALRQYYYLLIFFSKMAMDERMALHEEYKDADEVPWEISEMELPPTDVMIDNLPMTAGKGMGKKVVAKLEERAAKKGKK